MAGVSDVSLLAWHRRIWGGQIDGQITFFKGELSCPEAMDGNHGEVYHGFQKTL